MLTSPGQDRGGSPFHPHPRPPRPPQPIPSVTPFPQSSLARESVRGPSDMFTGRRSLLRRSLVPRLPSGQSRAAPRSLFEVSLWSTSYRSPARATALGERSEAMRCNARGMSSADPEGRATQSVGEDGGAVGWDWKGPGCVALSAPRRPGASKAVVATEFVTNTHRTSGASKSALAVDFLFTSHRTRVSRTFNTKFAVIPYTALAARIEQQHHQMAHRQNNVDNPILAHISENKSQIHGHHSPGHATA